jgi:hypothetical protein
MGTLGRRTRFQVVLLTSHLQQVTRSELPSVCSHAENSMQLLARLCVYMYIIKNSSALVFARWNQESAALAFQITLRVVHR